MSEYEASVAHAMNNIADALRTLAGSLASIAAAAHTSNPYDQSQAAAAIYMQAEDRYGDILKKLNKRQRADLEQWLGELVRPKK